MKDKYDNQLSVRFSREDVEKIEKAAKTVGLKPTQFVRTSVIKILNSEYPNLELETAKAA